MNILERYRHSRGFGVHSPFAFALVNDVLRRSRGYAYYGDEELDHVIYNCNPAHGRRVRRRACVLLRLAARLGFSSAWVDKSLCGNERRILMLALRLANPSISFSTPASLIIVRAITAERFRELTGSGCSVMVTEPEETLATSAPGFLFESRNYVLFVASKSVESCVSYSIL